MRFLELKIPPPAVAILIGAAMGFLAPLGPSVALWSTLRMVMSVGIALAGAAIALAGDLEFKRAKTTINPFRPGNATTLVTSGVFRRTRNPMYVGLTLVVLGWAVYLDSMGALLGPVLFVAYIDRFQIVPEERILSEKFGAAYAQYTSRVRRWF